MLVADSQMFGFRVFTQPMGGDIFTEMPKGGFLTA